jgi:hypothetical protein
MLCFGLGAFGFACPILLNYYKVHPETDVLSGDLTPANLDSIAPYLCFFIVSAGWVIGWILPSHLMIFSRGYRRTERKVTISSHSNP